VDRVGRDIHGADVIIVGKGAPHQNTAQYLCRRFDPGGSLDRRVKLSLRVPAQMSWREMEHKGENAARVILRRGMRSL
jgi:hypothetical protein